MSRVATPPLSIATRPPVSELPPSRTLSRAAGSVAQAPQGGRLLLPEAHRGVSSFEATTGVVSPQATTPDVSLVVRGRLNDVLRRAPGYQSTVDRIASQLTPQEQRMIMTAPPEKREEVRAQIQQKHEALAQQMRNAAASVDQPFNPAERQDGLTKSTQALKDSVNQMFDLATQQLEHVSPEWRQQAVFDAYVQRDRMLVSAYRNILDRVTPTPPPAPLPVPDTAS